MRPFGISRQQNQAVNACGLNAIGIPMNNLTFVNRLRLLGGFVVIVLCVLVAFGHSMLSNMSAVADGMFNRGLVGSKLLADANNAAWELRFGIANYTLASPENRTKILEARPAFFETLDQSLKKYSSLGSGGDQDPAMKELNEALSAYKAGAPKWFQLIDESKKEEAAEFRAKVTNVAGGAMVKNIKLLIEKQLKTNETLQLEATDTAKRANSLLLALGGAALIMVVLVVWLLTGSITRELAGIQNEIEGIQQSNDYTRRASVSGDNEISHTAASFNRLMETTQNSLRELISAVERVSQAASTLSASSGRVAQGSEQQAEATSSMAATVEQVTVSINTVSENARNAMDLSASSDNISARGRDIIQQTVSEVLNISTAMRRTADVIGELGEHSSQISSVVQVIKEVADQTNLLALNAAIEAARAGEQGRGFAVVADEVRKLAERTTKSTQEITEMISTIQRSAQEAVTSMSTALHQMDGGVGLAKQAGESIDEIQRQSQQVTHVVREIAGALKEQSVASNDLANNVESVARMTDSNTAATEQIAHATRELDHLVEAMKSVGQRFRV